MSLTDFSSYRTISSEDFSLFRPSSRRSFGRKADNVTDPVKEENPSPEPQIEELPVKKEEEEVKGWSHSLLMRIDGKDFRDLVCRFFQEKGFMYAEANLGSEDGPDILLYRPGEKRPYAVLKCQSWCDHFIGIKELRELLGTMAHIGLEHAVFVTTCCFTEAAQQFAADREIGLMDGKTFALQLINSDESFRNSTLKRYAATVGMAPSCPVCGGEMELCRENHERQGEVKFYRCLGYPVCRHTLPFPRDIK